jgi:hypothetical protein
MTDGLKTLVAGIVAAITITVSILTWMEARFATKAEDNFKYYELLIGVNEIRLQNYERRGVDTLDDVDRRKYEALKKVNGELESLRLSLQ